MPGNTSFLSIYTIEHTWTMNEVFLLTKIKKTKQKFWYLCGFQSDLLTSNSALRWMVITWATWLLSNGRSEVKVAFSQFLETVILKFLMFLSSKNLTIHVNTPLVLPLIWSIFWEDVESVTLTLTLSSWIFLRQDNHFFSQGFCSFWYCHRKQLWILRIGCEF